MSKTIITIGRQFGSAGREIGKKLAEELIDKANLTTNDIVVVGCSSSEILGDNMGTNSSPELGEKVFLALNKVFKEKGIFIAAQCCEHLNRAIIVEKSAVPYSEYVNVPNRNGEKYEGVNVVSPTFFYIDYQGNFKDKVGKEEKEYIDWAHKNGYKVRTVGKHNKYCCKGKDRVGS